MSLQDLPPPSWPAPAAPPPPPSTGRPRRTVVLVVVGVVSLLLVAAAVLALVLLALRAGPELLVDDPTYVELDGAERDAVMRRATEVGVLLDAWWAEELAARDLPYAPVGDRLTDGDDGVLCDDVPVEPDEDLVDNAYAAVCDEGAVVAIDPATFRGSDVALQVVLAHEWGHVVQAADPDLLDEIVADPTAVYAETELQADCYAGAWAVVHLPDQLDAAEQELRLIADPEDVPLDDPDGHGTADERALAFRLGVDHGVDACLPDRFDAR